MAYVRKSLRPWIDVRTTAKVIRSFGDSATARLWSRQHVKSYDRRIERAALRKLAMLDAAEIVEEFEIVHGKRRITADTALRLSRFFGTTDLFWLNLQVRFDLEVERDNLGSTLEAIVPLQSA